MPRPYGSSPKEGSISDGWEYGRRHGMTEIATYTLGAGVDYAPYEATRRFYFSEGFTIYQKSTTNSPGCPEEIRVKKRIGPPDVAGDG